MQIEKCCLKLFQTALLLITLYDLLLISFTAFTKASESEGSKEERSAWTIFEHTAPLPYLDMRYGGRVSTHSRPKAAGYRHQYAIGTLTVSTHSRPKAAGQAHITDFVVILSFNTQPPEGGWAELVLTNHHFFVSTHSRPKAAGRRKPKPPCNVNSFNTQPPEGGWEPMTALNC